MSSRSRPRHEAVIAMLADGEFHSGAALARDLGVSRTAVWKHMRALERLGLVFEAQAGKGYRLGAPLDLLDEQRVIASLGDAVRGRLESLDLHWSIPSTNDWLLNQPPPADGRFRLCLAEFQQAGRGRRGRTWIAPFGGGLCLSLGWKFATQPPDFAALSLLAGVACARGLKELGLAGHGLKWPNDLILGDAKLGGILTELRGEADGPVYAVMGVGLNIRLTDSLRERLREEAALPPAELSGVLPAPIPRSVLAATLARHLVLALEHYAEAGFGDFVREYALLDVLCGRRIRVSDGAGAPCEGIARGIDRDGALLVESAGGTRRFFGGEVSVRALR